MKVNTQRIVEMCIDDGIKDALGACKDIGATDEQLAEQISNFIWHQLNHYFDFKQ
jgi:predicted Zn-dependent protease with MMP-like domain